MAIEDGETTETRARKPRGVGSIDQGGRILGLLSRASKPMMLREIADELGVAPANLHPYMVSFRRMKMVEQTERGLYQLGPFALQLGLTRLRQQDAYREAIARVGELSETLELMVSLSTWGPFGASIVYVQEFAERLHANVRVGGVYDMTTTATGRVFAAFLPSEMTRPVIEQELSGARGTRQDGSSVSREGYADSVERTREQGWQWTRDQPIPGVSAVAAPVFDHTGMLQLCVTVIGATGLIDISSEGPVVRQLLDFTQSLSADLGYPGRPAEGPTA